MCTTQQNSATTSQVVLSPLEVDPKSRLVLKIIFIQLIKVESLACFIFFSQLGCWLRRIIVLYEG